MTTERALLAAVLADPDDDGPRLIYADWLDEKAGLVRCPACNGTAVRWKGDTRLVGKDRFEVPCLLCDGAAVVPDGWHERAEFIRVQCALGGVFEPHVCGFHHAADCWVCRLRRRERELLQTVVQNTHNGLAVAFCEWAGPAAVGVCPTFAPGWRHEDSWRFRRGFVESVLCAAADWVARGPAILAAQPVTRVVLAEVGMDLCRNRMPVAMYAGLLGELAARLASAPFPELAAMAAEARVVWGVMA